MKIVKLLCVFAAYLLNSCVGTAQEYKLVWEDDFNSEELNVSFWNSEKNRRGGGNAEMQYYIPENATIEKHPSGVSCLVLNAKKENYKDEGGGVRPVTSARLNTQGKITFTYGKLEARIHVPKTADGLWPAFWMLGDDYAISPYENDDSSDTLRAEFEKRGKFIWPKCGEIDILEMGHVDAIKGNPKNKVQAGTQDRHFNGACHWGEKWYEGGWKKDFFIETQTKTADYPLQDGFHLWTLIWTPNSIKMYLDLDKYPDTKPYFEMSIAGNGEPNHPSKYFHKPFHLLLNLAVGGYFTGMPAPEKYSAIINDDCEQFQKITALPNNGAPAKMYVDYIRLYQRGDKGETFSINK